MTKSKGLTYNQFEKLASWCRKNKPFIESPKTKWPDITGAVSNTKADTSNGEIMGIGRVYAERDLIVEACRMARVQPPTQGQTI